MCKRLNIFNITNILIYIVTILIFVTILCFYSAVFLWQEHIFVSISKCKKCETCIIDRKK